MPGPCSAPRRGPPYRSRRRGRRRTQSHEGDAENHGREGAEQGGGDAEQRQDEAEHHHGRPAHTIRQRAGHGGAYGAEKVKCEDQTFLRLVETIGSGLEPKPGIVVDRHEAAHHQKREAVDQDEPHIGQGASKGPQLVLEIRRMRPKVS